MSLIDRLARLPPAPAPPQVPERLVEVAGRVRQRFGDRRPVKPEALNILISRLTQATRNWDWKQLTDGEMAQVVRAWASQLATLAPDIEDFLLRELRCTTRRSLLGALCDGYLTGWVAREPRTSELARIIQARAAFLPRFWQIAFRATPESLDPADGAIRFGRWLAAQADPYRAVIARGILAPHGPGFMTEAHEAWLSASPEPVDEPTVRRMLAWIHPASAPRLEGDRAAAVVARLLRPWTARMPAKPLRTLLLNELIGHRGDPRHQNPHFWMQVGEDGKRILLRWLAGQRMEAFLDVVSQAAANMNQGSQWPPRRKFWMGLYEDGRIDEAWPSFGKDAQAIADNLNWSAANAANSPAGGVFFGRQATNRSLLIMKIGKKIVVEGSHDFRVHIFDLGKRGTPDLYQGEYELNELILPRDDKENTHWHDPQGRWMDWVREKIG